jgi:thiol-disulfide isomerase/thioredoxin
MRYFNCIVLVFIVLSCQKKESISKSSLPQPIQDTLVGGIRLQTFDFEGFKPFLNPANDTLYVFNFWATWCEPCVEELPYFEQMNEKYGKEKFKMVLVSLDFPKMTYSRLLPFIQNKQLKSKVIHLIDPNANSWIEQVDKNWSGAIPATLFIQGNQRRFYEKSFDLKSLESEIKSLIQ